VLIALCPAPLVQPGLWLASLAFAWFYRTTSGGAAAGGHAAQAAFLAVVELVSRSGAPVFASFLPWALAVSADRGRHHWIAELLHRRLLVVQENMSEAALVLTPAGVVRKAGGAVQHALGQKPADVEGTRFERFLDSPSREQLRDVLRGKHEGRGLELRTEGVKRGVRLLRVTVHDRRAVRRFRGYLLRVRDVTSERRAEEQARRVSRMQAIGALSAALGHDLNNALTTIQGNADLLSEDLAGNSQAQARLARSRGRPSGPTQVGSLAFTRRRCAQAAGWRPFWRNSPRSRCWARHSGKRAGGG
jgi:PAS domain S-box-containing protein